MSDQSAEWRKPSDIMRVHLKRRSTLKRCKASPNSPTTLPIIKNNPCSRKRKNPFGCSPNVKCPSEREEPDTNQETNRLLDILSNGAKAVDQLEEISISDVLSDSDKVIAGNNESKAVFHKVKVPETIHQETKSYYPKDWCLKMKARYLSSTTFSWCFPLKTVDEVKGMESLVQNLSPPIHKKSCSVVEELVLSSVVFQLCELCSNYQSSEITAQDAEVKAEFHRCCLYWMHPNIPWLKLFPRIATDNQIGRMSVVLQERDVVDSLFADWIESFTSVFHLLRAGSCPYFYVCCHHFTVAFFAATTDHPMVALVSPTSRGFREALLSEGIKFTLPLRQKNDSVETNTGNEVENTTTTKQMTETDNSNDINEVEESEEKDGGTVKDSDDLEQTDDGAASWLEALGLDKKQFHSLDPNRVRLQRDNYKLIDNRPASTVLVKEHDVQALFNFLLNCRSCIANTGIQAGIPPTLLSPTTFKGATLRTLKVKPSVLHKVSAEGQGYSLEITGPILPTAYSRLNHLLTLTQKDYSATYSVHEPTTPFNVKDNVCDKENVSADQSMEMNLGKEAVRELKYTEHGFLWKTY